MGMPIIEEVDSGVDVDAMSASTSRESSPTLHKKELLNNTTGIMEDEDDDIDETLGERLWGLTEMFPERMRNFTSVVAHGSISGIKSLYSLSRSVLWIFFSSSAILVAPVIFEAERLQMEEAAKQQQRQILLGPSAVAGGSGMHNLGMTMPPPQQTSPPQRYFFLNSGKDSEDCLEIQETWQ